MNEPSAAGGLTVRPFAPADQAAARRLILEGLGEHFGFVDETRNRDLDDIATFYAGALFLVALQGEDVVGTGAIVRIGRSTAQIVRMSVDRRFRRRGIARMVLARLLEQTRGLGYRWAVLETNAGWEDADAFYRASGFRELGRGLGGVAFALDLRDPGRPLPLPRSWALLGRLLWRHVSSR